MQNQQNNDANIEEEHINVDEAELMGQQLIELELFEAEKYEQQLQQNSQKMIGQQNQDQVEQMNSNKICKNPISPYMVFIGTWKTRHPNQKFNMAQMGKIWKQMSISEKQMFEVEYKDRKQQYDNFQAQKLMYNANAQQPEETGPKYLFPLHRVKSIMKQDPFYTPKVQATTTMAKATEYFAEFMLEQIKKMSDGKNRIDGKVLYESINNQRCFSFLDCLIVQYNKENGDSNKKAKSQAPLPLEVQEKKQKKVDKSIITKKQMQELGKNNYGQMSLDGFIKKKSQ